MDIKVELNLDDNTTNEETYQDTDVDNMMQYNVDERNVQLTSTDTTSTSTSNETYIKQEIDECSEYAIMDIQQDVLNIKHENIHLSETDPEVAAYINELKPKRATDLYSVVFPKSQKNKKYYSCSICNHLFSYRRQLICHLRTHTGEKPYNCNLCDYKSTQKVNLTCHIRRNHTGEKPYICTYCNFKSATKYQLICHVRSHTGEKPFSCFFCDYRCAHKVDMIRHMRTHTGEKPFACTFCDHKCADKRDLMHHVRTHTGERPYSCNFCDYKSIKKSYLNAHLKVHTGEKPFGCDLCDYKCSRKAVLARHLKVHAEGKKKKSSKRGLGLKAWNNRKREKSAVEECGSKEPENNLVVEEIGGSQLEKIKIEACFIKEEKL